MNTGFLGSDPIHLLGECAACPNARLANRLTALLLLAGDGHSVVAPCQTARRLHTRTRPTAVSRLNNLG